MPTVFEKLQLKDAAEILVLNAPPEFEPALAELRDVAIHRDADAVSSVRFALAFATTRAEVDRLARLLVAKAEGDALIWFAYPKQTSKRLRCDFNRDTGWATLRELRWDTVRQVALDADWSALRFRRVENIEALKGQTRAERQQRAD